MTIDLNDPWLQERSRAMHADLDATQDREAQTVIMRRHLDAALSSRGVAADDYAGFNDMLKDLYHAACPQPEPDNRMLVGMGLMSPLDTRPYPFPEDLRRHETPQDAIELTPEETTAYFRQLLSKPPETP